jgi:hypothetical protein
MADGKGRDVYRWTIQCAGVVGDIIEPVAIKGGYFALYSTTTTRGTFLPSDDFVSQ